MAYETGTATSYDDLLVKLRTFCITNGWTSNRFDVEGSGHAISLQKSTDMFLNIHSDYDSSSPYYGGDEFALYGSTGYSAGSNWDSQAGGGTLMEHGTSALAFSEYNFFSQGDNIVCVALRSDTKSHIFGWGRDTKGNPWYSMDGGAPFFGGDSNPSVKSARILQSGAYVPQLIGPYSRMAFTDYYRSPNVAEIAFGIDQFSGNRLLVPVHFIVDAGSGKFRIAGTTSDDICMYNGISDSWGREVTIGSDTYKLFPMNSTSSNNQYSIEDDNILNLTEAPDCHYGLALKK